MRENKYQSELIKRIYTIFPDCEVLKNDSRYRQGIPDIIVLLKGFWAMLEVKASGNASHQPNQEYYVDKFNGYSFAAFIHPANEEEVLSALQQAYRDRG